MTSLDNFIIHFKCTSKVKQCKLHETMSTTISILANFTLDLGGTPNVEQIKLGISNANIFL